MKRVVVTGGSGRLGRYVVKELLENGYQVFVVDERKPDDLDCPFVLANLNEPGDALNILQDADALVHLAAYPGGEGRTQNYIFFNNVMSTYHILAAAAAYGIRKVVVASSESSYGFFWGKTPALPQYFPVDENHPQLPEEEYGLSKIINEQTAMMFHRKTGMQIVSMRFSYILLPQDYPWIVQSFDRPEHFVRNLWGGVDVRDAAVACRLALEADHLGAAVLNIVGDVSLSDKPTQYLIERFFPDVPVKRPLGEFAPLVSNESAKRLLNWQPKYSWRNA